VNTAQPPRDLILLISRAEGLAVRRLAAALQEQAPDASIEQWRVLALLADGRGHTMSEVADHALLPAPTATKLADRLVSGNLVYRHPDPADRRRVLVHLTDRGRELHDRLATALAALQAEFAPPLGGEAELHGLLSRLVDALEAAPVARMSSG
jgi:DNA-binding MarR family transcriptional regulator